MTTTSRRPDSGVRLLRGSSLRVNNHWRIVYASEYDCRNNCDDCQTKHNANSDIDPGVRGFWDWYEFVSVQDTSELSFGTEFLISKLAYIPGFWIAAR